MDSCWYTNLQSITYREIVVLPHMINNLSFHITIDIVPGDIVTWLLKYVANGVVIMSSGQLGLCKTIVYKTSFIT